MQSLKALNLVEGCLVPKGGYRATGSAYEALNVEATGDVVTVPVLRNGVLMEGTTASELIFNKVMHTQLCDGVIRIIGNIRDFNVGDEVEVGPTPVNKLYIRGTVRGRDDTMSRLIIHGRDDIRAQVGHQEDRPSRSAHSLELPCRRQRAFGAQRVQEALVEDSSPGMAN